MISEWCETKRPVRRNERELPADAVGGGDEPALVDDGGAAQLGAERRFEGRDEWQVTPVGRHAAHDLAADRAQQAAPAARHSRHWPRRASIAVIRAEHTSLIIYIHHSAVSGVCLDLRVLTAPSELAVPFD